MTRGQQNIFLRKLGKKERDRLPHSWDFHGRPKQRWDPDGPNFQGLVSGRGGGKSRSGAERSHEVAEDPESCGGEMIIGGATAGDVRDLMIEGPSGLEATQKPWNPIVYESSKKLVTWKSGVVGHLRSSEKPRSFRGINAGFAWLDEIAFWSDVQACWDNIEFALRYGNPSTLLFTTTPLPTIFIRNLIKDPDIKITGGSSYENEANLDPTWFKRIRKKYEGTRLGDQEIHGLVLLDNPNQIWNQDWIRRLDPWDCEGLFARTVVAVDPAGGSTSKKSDEHGIVGVSSGHQGQLYTRADRSVGKGDNDWPEEATDLALQLNADAIVGEINFGGEMVERALNSVKKFRDSGIPFVMVRAMAPKAERAKLPARIYEKQMGFHVGRFPELEEQMTMWDPTIKRIEGKSKTQFSPDRMDAQVHGYLHLMQLESGDGGAFEEYDPEEFESLVQIVGGY